MKLPKLKSPSWLIPIALIFVCFILLLGCNDAQDIIPLTSQAGPSLSADRYSAKYSKEEAVRIFKSGDDEAINKVLMSKESVIWDGKSKFKNGVGYSIPEDMIEKAREISEDFRRANDMDRAWQRTGKMPRGGKKIKKKSSSPGLSGFSGVSVDAWTLCGETIGMARAIAMVEIQMCYCGANVYVRVGNKSRWDQDAGFGKLIYVGKMLVDYGSGGAFAVCEGWGCLGGEMDAHSCTRY